MEKMELGGDPLPPEEQLWVLGTPEGAVWNAGDFQREQLWVLGATNEAAVGDGDCLPPRRHLGEGAKTHNGGARCVEDLQWSNWRCWGSHREEMGIAGTTPTRPPSSLREQQWYWGPTREETGVLGTTLSVK